MRSTNTDNVNFTAEEVVMMGEHRMSNRRIPGTGPLTPMEPGAKLVMSSYGIKFHMKSGKTFEMKVQEFDNYGNRNTIENVQRLINDIDRKLEERGAWISRSLTDPGQNFRVYDSALEAIEVVELR